MEKQSISIKAELDNQDRLRAAVERQTPLKDNTKRKAVDVASVPEIANIDKVAILNLEVNYQDFAKSEVVKASETSTPEPIKHTAIEAVPIVEVDELKFEEPAAKEPATSVTPIIELPAEAKAIVTVSVKSHEDTPIETEGVEITEIIPDELRSLADELLESAKSDIDYELGVIDVAEQADVLPVVGELMEAQTIMDDLPETVQLRIADYEATAEPEDVIVLSSQKIKLENSIVAMEKLVLDEAGPEKIAKSEALAAEIYDELLQEIGIEDKARRAELVEEFIVMIRAKANDKLETMSQEAEVEDHAVITSDTLAMSVQSFVNDPLNFSKYLLGKFTISKSNKIQFSGA